MKIYIGTDHAGFEFKNKVVKYLTESGHEIVDKGAFIFDKNDDYPDFITPVAEAVSGDTASIGIILGGSGQGEAMCANRIKGVRAMVFYGTKKAVSSIDITGKESDKEFEMVSISREHDCSNIISLGMRFISENDAITAIDLFLESKYSNVDRHIRRVNKF